MVPQEPEAPAQAAPPAECEANCAHHRPVLLSWARLLTEIDVAAWQGVLAPKGTPKAIVDRLHAEILTVLRNPKVIGTMGDSGTLATPSTPAEFAALIKSERALWEPLIKSWKISLD